MVYPTNNIKVGKCYTSQFLKREKNQLLANLNYDRYHAVLNLQTNSVWVFLTSSILQPKLYQ